jgi:A/G-specific adenine glycosylase
VPEFARKLVLWQRQHGRHGLPWQGTRDPYRVWLSEIMLQQTQVAAVIPYYERFLARFPDFKSLARAREESVLKLWSGLGYYSRARNLHRAAQKVVAEHDSQFPGTLEEALALPGIGRYTAAAVLSIAYDVPLAVLDGNVARVLARLDAVRGDLRVPDAWKRLGERAHTLLAPRAAGDWNQAVMELGEVVCTPQSPHCDECPIAAHCRAKRLDLVDEIPAPRKKPAQVRQRIAAAILRDPAGRTLLVADPGAHDEVLFSRMWQFPAIEVRRDAHAELADHLHASLGIRADALHALPAARHGVTFRNITLLPFLANVASLPVRDRTRILPLAGLQQPNNLPISSATRKIAAAALSSAPANRDA